MSRRLIYHLPHPHPHGMNNVKHTLYVRLT